MVYGVGYSSGDKYKKYINGKRTKCYKTWQGMLERCYNPYCINKHLSYIDCTVCEEWHDFQNFAKWYEENYYEIEGEEIALDKDILIKENKIYSPSTCIFVPKRINTLFTKSNKMRGSLPLGVTSSGEKFRARCSIIKNNGKYGEYYIGTFSTIEEAFNSYKIFKENYIKQVADEYKDLIPKELYEAMYRWRVDIDD